MNATAHAPRRLRRLIGRRAKGSHYMYCSHFYWGMFRLQRPSRIPRARSFWGPWPSGSPTLAPRARTHARTCAMGMCSRVLGPAQGALDKAAGWRHVVRASRDRGADVEGAPCRATPHHPPPFYQGSRARDLETKCVPKWAVSHRWV